MIKYEDIDHTLLASPLVHQGHAFNEPASNPPYHATKVYLPTMWRVDGRPESLRYMEVMYELDATKWCCGGSQIQAAHANVYHIIPNGSVVPGYGDRGLLPMQRKWNPVGMQAGPYSKGYGTTGEWAAKFNDKDPHLAAVNINAVLGKDAVSMAEAFSYTYLSAAVPLVYPYTFRTGYTTLGISPLRTTLSELMWAAKTLIDSKKVPITAFYTASLPPPEYQGTFRQVVHTVSVSGNKSKPMPPHVPNAELIRWADVRASMLHHVFPHGRFATADHGSAIATYMVEKRIVGEHRAY